MCIIWFHTYFCDILTAVISDNAQENTMFKNTDNTFNEIRERSLLKWLDDMEKHEDVEVRGGVRLCREYMNYLIEQNAKLKQECELKNSYLKKMAEKYK